MLTKYTFILGMLFLSIPGATLWAWPAGAVPGGTYTLQEGDQNIVSGDELFLPDSFTIVVPATIHAITWTFKRVRFGRFCTIDLSANQTKPRKAANGAGSKQPSARWCTRGANGAVGGTGAAGAGGASLTLNAKSIDSTGSLWIRTDGGPGGDGGDGGNGQDGGTNSCREREGGPCAGGDGGVGGMGGNGGEGGSTSIVHLNISGIGQMPVISPVECQACGRSSRPQSSITSNGIFIWGSPGCGGSGGTGGAGGGGGVHAGEPNGERCCGILSSNCQPAGRNTLGGPQGLPGRSGTCSKSN
jgi:hypothetical protein